MHIQSILNGKRSHFPTNLYAGVRNCCFNIYEHLWLDSNIGKNRIHIGRTFFVQECEDYMDIVVLRLCWTKNAICHWLFRRKPRKRHTLGYNKTTHKYLYCHKKLLCNIWKRLVSRKSLQIHIAHSVMRIEISYKCFVKTIINQRTIVYIVNSSGCLWIRSCHHSRLKSKKVQFREA